MILSLKSEVVKYFLDYYYIIHCITDMDTNVTHRNCSG